MLADAFNGAPKEYIGRFVVAILVVIAISTMFLVYYYLDVTEDAGTSANEISSEDIADCIDIGCPEGTVYVGSSESNVYHKCHSGYAVTILPQNRLCFYNASEAEAAGYRPAAGL